MDDEVRFSQNFEALRIAIEVEESNKNDNQPPLTGKRHTKNKYSGDLAFD